MLGTERIGRWEHIVIEWAKRAMPIQWPYGKDKQNIEIAGIGQNVEEYATVDPNSPNVAVARYDHGVKEAYERNKGENASKSILNTTCLQKNPPTLFVTLPWLFTPHLRSEG